MKLFVTLALLSVLCGQVMTLECLVGQRINDTIGSMQTVTCGFEASGISHSCLRHDLVITYQGSTGKS